MLTGESFHWCGKMLIVACLALLTSLTTNFMLATKAEEHSYQPKSGFVPDEKTAILIAEAVLMPIYGKEKIENERPFVATLKDDVWHIQGALPEAYVGGVAVVDISKRDGKIYRVSHGK